MALPLRQLPQPQSQDARGRARDHDRPAEPTACRTHCLRISRILPLLLHVAHVPFRRGIRPQRTHRIALPQSCIARAPPSCGASATHYPSSAQDPRHPPPAMHSARRRFRAAAPPAERTIRPDSRARRAGATSRGASEASSAAPAAFHRRLAEPRRIDKGQREPFVDDAAGAAVEARSNEGPGETTRAGRSR